MRELTKDDLVKVGDFLKELMGGELLMMTTHEQQGISVSEDGLQDSVRLVAVMTITDGEASEDVAHDLAEMHEMLDYTIGVGLEAAKTVLVAISEGMVSIIDGPQMAHPETETAD